MTTLKNIRVSGRKIVHARTTWKADAGWKAPHCTPDGVTARNTGKLTQWVDTDQPVTCKKCLRYNLPTAPAQPLADSLRPLIEKLEKVADEAGWEADGPARDVEAIEDIEFWHDALNPDPEDVVTIAPTTVRTVDLKPGMVVKLPHWNTPAEVVGVSFNLSAPTGSTHVAFRNASPALWDRELIWTIVGKETAMITDKDVRAQVLTSLGDYIDEHDVDKIVATVIDRYGLVDIDKIPVVRYWQIVIDCAI